MLIRRQDKKAIFNIDTCRVLYVAETVGGCFKICADQFEQLGTYKTEERAMEVLDMIATQSALCNAGVAVYLADEIEKLGIWICRRSEDRMTKEELVIGNRYKIRRPSIADGNVNSYQWSDATLVDISTYIAVFSVGEYCVTYKFCQLRDEVKEA